MSTPTYAERVVALIHECLAENAQMTQEHLSWRAEGWDCGCSTKDCYECGYYHNCKHGTPGVLRDILMKASQ